MQTSGEDATFFLFLLLILFIFMGMEIAFAMGLSSLFYIIVTQFMKRYHYLRKEIDNQTSSLMLDRYLESLDPNKHFFLNLLFFIFHSFQQVLYLLR